MTHTFQKPGSYSFGDIPPSGPLLQFFHGFRGTVGDELKPIRYSLKDLLSLFQKILWKFDPDLISRFLIQKDIKILCESHRYL